MAQLAVIIGGLLLIAPSQASDVVDRSTPQAFLSKYMSSGAAFAPRATRTAVFSGEDYASMDGPALAAAIDGKRKELFDMRLENRQGRQKATFKSNVVRNLKKDIARMMPFLEAKQASSNPNMVLREQAQGRRENSKSYAKFITPTFNHVKRGSIPGATSDKEENQVTQNMLANDSYKPMTLSAIGVGLLALATMLGVRMRRRLQPATALASSDGLAPVVFAVTASAPGDNIMEMKSQDAESPQNSLPLTVSYAARSSSPASGLAEAPGAFAPRGGLPTAARSSPTSQTERKVIG